MSELWTTSVVMYGDFEVRDSDGWRSFFDYSTAIVRQVGCDLNYLGATGDSFKSRRVSQIARVEKRLRRALDQGEALSCLELYALPDDFQTAAFDYRIYMLRTKELNGSHILATFVDPLYGQLRSGEIIAGMKRFIRFEHGQVFRLQIDEVPQLYAARANPLSAYSSLQVLSEF